MRLLSIVALGTFALALSTVGCSADSGEEAPAASENELSVAAEEIATDADEGKTVRVYEGQDFVLRLPANATTGYQWKVTRTNRTFAYPYASTYETAATRGRPTLEGEPTGLPIAPPVGSGGTAVFKWHTNPVTDVTGAPVMSKIGKHALTLEYRRPWESADAPAAKTFSITVEVVRMPDFPFPPKNDDQCGDDVCSDGQSCQFCWGQLACIPRGAIC
ncbi:MAG: protease inhibitor I42 family protein [Labilithrix sp.]|nr:protease inhibitor I42 family protein [Labilithrix sp.]MCW5813155.1 protease inhibitor I42 family protein [Labilithrix sp.]